MGEYPRLVHLLRAVDYQDAGFVAEEIAYGVRRRASELSEIRGAVVLFQKNAHGGLILTSGR